MSGGEVVFAKDGYKIKRVVVPEDFYNPERGEWVFKKGEVIYNIYSPEGKLLLGNRESLEEAKRDLGSYIKAGGEGAYQEVSWRGSKVPILSSGGGYDIGQLDKEIKDLVLDLNYYGFQTDASCAGHHGLKEGFINFVGELSLDEISDVRNVFKEHGIVGVRFNLEHHRGESYTRAKFPPLGKGG